MQPTRKAPPIAPRVPHEEVHHGETVTDDYHWLREKTDPEVTAYLKQENAYTTEMTKHLEPLAESLYTEMLSHIQETDLTVPVRRGDYLYYARTEEGKQYPLQCRRRGDMSASEEVLLDLNQIAKGHAFVGLGNMVVSDDQNLLAYTLDFTGFRQYTLNIKDLRTSEMLPSGVERVTSLEWCADNKTLLLTTEDEVTKRPDTLLRFVLGKADFETLYHEPDELYDIELSRTRDRRFLLLQIESKDTSECRYVPATEPGKDPQILLPRAKKRRYYVEHREGLFYLIINQDQNGVEMKDFAIVTTPVSDLSSERWLMFVPHRPGHQIENLSLFQGFAVVEEMSEALNHLRVYNFQTSQWSEIAFSEPVYTAAPGSTPEFASRSYRYNYESFVTPASVFDFSIDTGESTLLKRQEVPGAFSSDNYLSERLWALARDGVRIPLSIVYKNGFKRDGSGPLFLYAYGSYGIGMHAGFSAARLALLDRGVAFAIAHIRGGNELGERWREDGMLTKKKNTFYDFIDSAEYLIHEKWTASDRLLIEGGSAGGLLMGVVTNLRPDLFRAVHSAVPFVDVINTMFDETLPLTIGEYLEWGDPNEPDAYHYMKSYSPYDNLENKDYPAMLVTSSLNDSQVMYWEPAKYVAKLRRLKSNSTPLLLKMKMEPAGHGGASGRYDRLKDTAFEYAWLLSQLPSWQ